MVAVAAAGDPLALAVMHKAGLNLGQMLAVAWNRAKTGSSSLTRDVVAVGSVFNSIALIESGIRDGLRDGGWGSTTVRFLRLQASG